MSLTYFTLWKEHEYPLKIARKYGIELARIADGKFPGQKKELLRKTEIQYEEFMAVLCRQDHQIAEAMQERLVRYADGDDYCDWWYFGNKTLVTQEEKDYMAKQEREPL